MWLTVVGYGFKKNRGETEKEAEAYEVSAMDVVKMKKRSKLIIEKSQEECFQEALIECGIFLKRVRKSKLGHVW